MAKTVGDPGGGATLHLPKEPGIGRPYYTETVPVPPRGPKPSGKPNEKRMQRIVRNWHKS